MRAGAGGRVNATIELTVWSVMSVGSLLGGALGTWVGTRATFLVSGLVSCLAVGWPLARRTEIVGAAR